MTRPKKIDPVKVECPLCGALPNYACRGYVPIGVKVHHVRKLYAEKGAET